MAMLMKWSKGITTMMTAASLSVAYGHGLSRCIYVSTEASCRLPTFRTVYPAPSCRRFSTLAARCCNGDGEFQILQSKDGSIMFQFGTEEESKDESFNGSYSEEQVEAMRDMDGNMSSNIEEEKDIAESSLDHTKSSKSNKESFDSNVIIQKSDGQGDFNKGTQEKNNGSNEKKVILKLHSGAAVYPHPDKKSTGGEDAYFIEGLYWIGVADGVGGWASIGVNAGLYSRELMSNCATLIRKENGSLDAKAVICRSAKITKAIGSSTALVATLREQTLRVANIGDSGFLVVREGEVLARSQPMLHGFNFPVQIGSEGDDPSETETYDVAVRRGDVVVLGTDGLFDNVYESQIVETVTLALRQGAEPSETAKLLADRGHKQGSKRVGNSPFSDAAFANRLQFEGGKLDDVTVVVSYIE